MKKLIMSMVPNFSIILIVASVALSLFAAYKPNFNIGALAAPLTPPITPPFSPTPTPTSDPYESKFIFLSLNSDVTINDRFMFNWAWSPTNMLTVKSMTMTVTVPSGISIESMGSQCESGNGCTFQYTFQNQYYGGHSFGVFAKGITSGTHTLTTVFVENPGQTRMREATVVVHDATPSPTITPTPTIVPTPIPTPTTTPTSTPVITPTPTATPTVIPTPTPAPIVTRNLNITQGSDDAWETADINKTVKTSSQDLKIGWYAGYTGLRFAGNLSSLKGKTITSAILKLTSSLNNGQYIKVRIFAENSGNAKTFQAVQANLSNRLKTQSSVTWEPSVWGINKVYQTPNLASLLNEVIKRPDFSGNSLVILMKNYGSQNYTEKLFAADESTLRNAATLTITYQ